jgi:hypothetical protein
MKAKEISMAHGLMYKSYQLYFPAEFKISNQELSKLSGNPLTNIGRVRQNVIDACIYDGIPIFSYSSQKKNHYGKYRINYPIISQYYHNIITIKSEYYQNIVNDDDFLNNNKGNYFSSEKEKNSWLLDLLMNVAPGWGGPVNQSQSDMMDEILKFPDHQVRTVCTQAAKSGIRANGMLSWILKGLDNFSQFYEEKKKSDANNIYDTDVKRLNRTWQQLQDGILTRDKEPYMVVTMLNAYLPRIKQYEDQLDYTVGDFQNVIDEWKERASV